MRILLVEDEQKTGDYLKQGLSEAGYITDWVTDGLTGKQRWSHLFEQLKAYL